ncbi:hypothetical protein BH18ACT14_BH18ACT14_17680 [soil metagenome]
MNDAPALRQADVGIAMGRSGTEAAREAADIVLTDDDFSTIVAAIREGRRVGDNIRKFVAFLLSANLGEVLLFAVAISAGLGAPLTVVQVLAVNLLTDGLPALALSRDPESPDAMARGPLRGERLFAPGLWAALLGIGMLVGLAATLAFLVGRVGGEGSEQTMAFVTLAFAELVLVFSIRGVTRPPWRVPRNRYLELAVSRLDPRSRSHGLRSVAPRAAGNGLTWSLRAGNCARARGPSRCVPGAGEGIPVAAALKRRIAEAAASNIARRPASALRNTRIPIRGVPDARAARVVR